MQLSPNSFYTSIQLTSNQLLALHRRHSFGITYNSMATSDILLDQNIHLQKHLNSNNQQQQTHIDDKLPLKSAWGSYFYKADKQRDWKQNVIYITSINYIEDFWSFYTHTYGLGDLSNGSDYMFFKSGCLPMWEDVSSRGGGKWIIQIDPKRRQDQLESYWLHLMLLLIGDMFGSDVSPYINGAVVSLRVKGDRLALWLKKIDDRNIIKTIGLHLKDFLGLPPDIHLHYEYHEANNDNPLLV